MAFIKKEEEPKAGGKDKITWAPFDAITILPQIVEQGGALRSLVKLSSDIKTQGDFIPPQTYKLDNKHLSNMPPMVVVGTLEDLAKAKVSYTETGIVVTIKKGKDDITTTITIADKHLKTANVGGPVVEKPGQDSKGFIVERRFTTGVKADEAVTGNALGFIVFVGAAYHSEGETIVGFEIMPPAPQPTPTAAT